MSVHDLKAQKQKQLEDQKKEYELKLELKDDRLEVEKQKNDEL